MRATGWRAAHDLVRAANEAEGEGTYDLSDVRVEVVFDEDGTSTCWAFIDPRVCSEGAPTIKDALEVFAAHLRGVRS